MFEGSQRARSMSVVSEGGGSVFEGEGGSHPTMPGVSPRNHPSPTASSPRRQSRGSSPTNNGSPGLINSSFMRNSGSNMMGSGNNPLEMSQSLASSSPLAKMNRAPPEGRAMSLFRLAKLKGRHERQKQLFEGGFGGRKEKKVQNRDRSVPVVREVLNVINERSKHRFNESVKYLAMTRRMKPPPPMSMDELEQHPLVRKKLMAQGGSGGSAFRGTVKAKAKKNDDSGSSEDEHDLMDPREKLPYLSDPVTRNHVKFRFEQEIADTETAILGASNFDVTSAVVMSPKAYRELEGPQTARSLKPIFKLGASTLGTSNNDDVESIDWATSINPAQQPQTARDRASVDVSGAVNNASIVSGGGGGGDYTASLTSRQGTMQLDASEKNEEMTVEEYMMKEKIARMSRSRSLSEGTISSGSCDSAEAFPEFILNRLRQEKEQTEREQEEAADEEAKAREVALLALDEIVEESEGTSSDGTNSSTAFLTQAEEVGKFTLPAQRRSLKGSSRRDSRGGSFTGSGFPNNLENSVSNNTTTVVSSKARRVASNLRNLRKKSMILSGPSGGAVGTSGALDGSMMGGGGGGPGDVPSGKSLKEMALGKTDSIFERDPDDFIRIRNEDKHSQSYKKGKFKPKLNVGGSQDPLSKDGFSSADVQYFLHSLRQRDHDFNVASLVEMERARNAHHTFRAFKTAQLDKFLELPKLKSAPMRKIIAIAKKRVADASAKKDHDERLDVFFEHVEQLEDHTRTTFPENEWPRIAKCLVAVRKLVRKTNGHQGTTEFTFIAKKFFRPEQFFLKNVEQFFSLLAPMFGFVANDYRTWLREKIDKFQNYDYEEQFRLHDRMIPGKELTKELRFRFHAYAVRGCHMPHHTKPPEFKLGIIVERHRLMTAVVADARPDWNESFVVHIYNAQSPVQLTVYCDDQEVGHGTFNVSRFSNGGQTKSRMWVPCPGPNNTHLHTKVNVGIDILPLPKTTGPGSPLQGSPSMRFKQQRNNEGVEGDEIQHTPQDGLFAPIDTSDPQNYSRDSLETASLADGDDGSSINTPRGNSSTMQPNVKIPKPPSSARLSKNGGSSRASLSSSANANYPKTARAGQSNPLSTSEPLVSLTPRAPSTTANDKNTAVAMESTSSQGNSRTSRGGGVRKR